jgi:folate-binding protein YgfZ
MNELRWETLTIDGNDAQQFLQGQISQDLSHDRSGGVWTLLLNADGTVVTSGWIRGAGEHWEFLVPKELADVAETRLRRFLLRVDCSVSRQGNSLDAPLRTDEERIEAGKPWSNEFSLGLAPHVFGNTFVHETISFTKGCFTGQELVGRMDARGASMPWRFVRITAPSIDEANTLLCSVGPAGPQGVTSVADSVNGVEALGIAHRSFFTSDVNVAQQRVRVEEIS